MRPVINLKELNGYLRYQHFKMEGAHLIKETLQKGDYMIKLDLKDAYFSIPIFHPHKKFLRFKWKNKTYQFSSLPFGITVAPYVFTKMLKTPVAYLRRMGIRLTIYLDDVLIMNQTREGALRDCKNALEVLQGLGFLINLEKSVTIPTQEMEFLGFLVNSIKITLSLPIKKVQKIQKLCRQVLEYNTISVRKLSVLIGNLTASIQAVLPAPLHYRHLQSVKNQNLRVSLDYDSLVHLTSETKIELQWWINQLHNWNGRSMLAPQITVNIQTDASNQGWGAVCNNVRIGGPWLITESHFHINVLELMAIQNAVKSFLRNKSDIQVLIQTDNKTALTYVNKMGGTVSNGCNQIALAIWEWCLQRNITPHAEFIPGKDNLIADWESRHHHDSSSWKLNPCMFQLLMNKTIPCTVDLFADRTNAKLKNYMSWFPDPEALAVNALVQS